jgi:hypothetical protein
MAKSSAEVSDIKWHVTILVGLTVLIMGLNNYRIEQKLDQCCPLPEPVTSVLYQ